MAAIFSISSVLTCLVGWFDHALGLPALHVQEQPAIISPVAPGLRPCPIDLHLIDRRRHLGILLDSQIPLLDQPFIEADSPVQPRSR